MTKITIGEKTLERIQISSCLYIHCYCYVVFLYYKLNIDLYVLQKLSTCLCLSRTGLGTKRMVVFLRDPLGRLWPVLCLEKTWLTSGWLDFQIANNIKPGDVCVFRVVNKFECIISVHINHK
jgi:hypothetical protein